VAATGSDVSNTLATILIQLQSYIVISLCQQHRGRHTDRQVQMFKILTEETDDGSSLFGC